MPVFASTGPNSPAFTSTEQATAVFAELMELLLADEHFATIVKRESLSVHFLYTKPDFELYVDEFGVRVTVIPAGSAITIKMSCDTADALWSGRMLMPIAVATGKIRIKGSVSKVLDFVPLLHPAFDRYPDVARAAGVRTTA